MKRSTITGRPGAYGCLARYRFDAVRSIRNFANARSAHERVPASVANFYRNFSKVHFCLVRQQPNRSKADDPSRSYDSTAYNSFLQAIRRETKRSPGPNTVFCGDARHQFRVFSSRRVGESAVGMRMEHRQESKTRIGFLRLIFHADIHRKIDCRHVGTVPGRASRTMIQHSLAISASHPFQSGANVKRDAGGGDGVTVACRVVEEG